MGETLNSDGDPTSSRIARAARFAGGRAQHYVPVSGTPIRQASTNF